MRKQRAWCDRASPRAEPESTSQPAAEEGDRLTRADRQSQRERACPVRQHARGFARLKSAAQIEACDSISFLLSFLFVLLPITRETWSQSEARERSSGCPRHPKKGGPGANYAEGTELAVRATARSDEHAAKKPTADQPPDATPLRRAHRPAAARPRSADRRAGHRCCE